jgi:hypothetical protein
VTDFTDAYRDLLIKQYWDKPRARAEIELQAATWEPIRDILAQFGPEFDVDTGTGDRLDILGRIVGIRRVDISEVGQLPAPIADDLYRYFIKLRIAHNAAAAFMVSDTKTTMQYVVQTAFPAMSYLIDNQDMTLSLTISNDADTDILLAIIRLGLLPKPHAVGYRTVIQEPIDPAFGFVEIGIDYDDIDGFSELDAVPLEGGKFSELFEV